MGGIRKNNNPKKKGEEESRIDVAGCGLGLVENRPHDLDILIGTCHDLPMQEKEQEKEKENYRQLESYPLWDFLSLGC